MVQRDCLKVDLLVALVESILDLILHLAAGTGHMHIRRLGSKTEPIGLQEPRLLMGKGYKPAQMSNWGYSWVKKSGELREPIADNHGHEAAAGLGRRPANPRWGPHFRDGGLEAVDAHEDASDDVYDHGQLDGETADDELAQELEPQQLDDDGWKFGVLMQNLMDLSHLDLFHVDTTTSPPPLRSVRNTLGFHREKKVIPERRFPMSRHRRL